MIVISEHSNLLITLLNTFNKFEKGILDIAKNVITIIMINVNIT